VRSTLLTYYFVAVPKSSPDPFGPELPTSRLRAGRIDIQYPLPRPTLALPMALPNRRSLLGLSPLEIVALGSVCHREAYLCEKPDFPSLPASVYLFNTRLRIIVSGPLLSARLAVP